MKAKNWITSSEYKRRAKIPNYPEFDIEYRKRRRKRERMGEVPRLLREPSVYGRPFGPGPRAAAKRAKREAVGS